MDLLDEENITKHSIESPQCNDRTLAPKYELRQPSSLKWSDFRGPNYFTLLPHETTSENTG